MFAIIAVLQDVDNYRSTVRAHLVEWFTALRDTQNSSNFLIVWDSNRCNNKTARLALLDKLRADFNKHHDQCVYVLLDDFYNHCSRLVEIDSSLKQNPAFVRTVRETVVKSVDQCVCKSEAELLSYKAQCYSPLFDLPDFITAQVC
jgi:hypothetical protein